MDQQTIPENANGSDLETGGKTFFMLCSVLLNNTLNFLNALIYQYSMVEETNIIKYLSNTLFRLNYCLIWFSFKILTILIKEIFGVDNIK